ncbi:MAG: hypothetical protein IH610_13065, partial [Deltaproteobacteria bacterium]|nr:hypothetical protein [Deltaproteobacteria bacterium]
MRIDCISADIRAVKADMVVVNLFEGAKRPGGAAAVVDAAIGGAITAAVRGGDFSGKLGEILSLRPSRGLSSPRVLVVGLGKKEKFASDHARQAILPVLKEAKRLKLSTVASVVHGAGAGGIDPGIAARFCALGAALSAFEFDRYKEEKAHRVARFLFVERDAKAFPTVRAGVSWGARVGEAINWGRSLVATPPAELRPDDLARAA